MKKISFILMVFLCLFLLMVPSVLATDTFTILNPRPSKLPIVAQPIALRLTDLDGKTIAVISNGNINMKPLAEKLLEILPNVKIIFISDMPIAVGQTPHPIELGSPIINMNLADFEKDPQIADAVIVGHGF